MANTMEYNGKGGDYPGKQNCPAERLGGSPIRRTGERRLVAWGTGAGEREDRLENDITHQSDPTEKREELARSNPPNSMAKGR